MTYQKIRAFRIASVIVFVVALIFTLAGCGTTTTTSTVGAASAVTPSSPPSCTAQVKAWESSTIASRTALADAMSQYSRDSARVHFAIGDEPTPGLLTTVMADAETVQATITVAGTDLPPDCNSQLRLDYTAALRQLGLAFTAMSTAYTQAESQEYVQAAVYASQGDSYMQQGVAYLDKARAGE